jgi:hypothetical protein
VIANIFVCNKVESYADEYCVVGRFLNSGPPTGRVCRRHLFATRELRYM